MTYYRVRYEKHNKTRSKIVKSGELGKMIDRCHKKRYHIINIEFV